MGSPSLATRPSHGTSMPWLTATRSPTAISRAGSCAHSPSRLTPTVLALASAMAFMACPDERLAMKSAYTTRFISTSSRMKLAQSFRSTHWQMPKMSPCARSEQGEITAAFRMAVVVMKIGRMPR
jgi:hypothetical protein